MKPPSGILPSLTHLPPGRSRTSPSDCGDFYAPQGKAGFVQDLFNRIAGRYDLLNSVTSFGMHHRWRSRAVELANIEDGSTVLDIACGTGDFLPLISRRVGEGGTVIGLDFSSPMLDIARRKMRQGGVSAFLAQGDAENLPFESESFHAVTTGFALRNLTDVQRAFEEMHRVLRSGGRAVALEIARPQSWPYGPAFLFYLKRVLPCLAAVFGGERQAYRWLPASLESFCSRDGVVEAMERAGFAKVTTEDLAAGAVCIYIGEKQ